MRLTSFTDYGLRMLMRMASAPDRASGFLALPRPILTGSHAETARASMPCRWYSTTK